MSEIEALKSLGPFPILQALIAIAIIGLGLWAFFRGTWDRRTAGPPTPASNGASPPWSLYGPVHETMVEISDIRENQRDIKGIQTRIEGVLREILKDQRDQREIQTNYIAKELRNQTQILEDIRNFFLSSPPPIRRK